MIKRTGFVRQLGCFSILMLLSWSSAGIHAQQCRGEASMETKQRLTRLAQALGGLENLEKIESLYIRGSVKMGGLSGTSEEWQTARGQHKASINLANVYKNTTIYDGSRGWVVNQNGKVIALAGTPLEDEILSAYLGSFSHLLPGRLEGCVKSLGEDRSRRFYTLQIAPKGGRSFSYYLDKATYLPAKQEIFREGRTTTILYSDWRDFGGVKFPFRMRQSDGNPNNDVLMTTEEVRFITPPDAQFFEKPAGMVKNFRFASGQQSVRIPFSLNSNHIFLQVRVNQSQPLRFFLDTGADVSVIDRRCAVALGLKLSGKLGVGAYGGSVEAAIAKGVSFGLPGVRVSDQTVAVISLDAFQEAGIGRIDGILGSDFIGEFVLEIDYARRFIILHDPATYSHGAGQALPLTIESAPFVKARILLEGREPIEGKFKVDTGSDLSLFLYRPFVESQNLLRANLKTLEISGVGAGGESRKLLARVKGIQLGEFTIADPIIGLAHGNSDDDGEEANADYSGVLGAEILHRFNVVLDYSRNQIFLEKSASFSEPFEEDMSGLVLDVTGSRSKTFKVIGVRQNSPAAEVGLRVGDVITVVDGKLASTYTLEQIERMLRGGERAYTLSVRRGGRFIKTEIKLRRMI